MTKRAPSETAAVFVFALPVDASKSSSIPAGGVIVLLSLSPKKPSTGAPSMLVVTEGATMRSELEVKTPEWAVRGAAVSTPLMATMPPAAPADEENRHVYELTRSPAPSTL
jgi:hypothetical protein